MPSTNRTSSGCTPSRSRRPRASRSRICSQAFFTAPPLRSAPELAAVAEVFGTLSVRVGRQPHRRQRHAERGRRDLQHLRVQALAHLGAAVVDQHRAVLVDVHQRAGLVERGQVERDAELHRRDRERPLGVRVRGVERRDLGRRRSTSPRLEHLVPDPLAAARRDAPAGRTGWSARRGRSCAAAARRASDPEQRARSGRGCPRSRACPAVRRSRGTRCARSCSSSRSARAPRCSGSSRRCRCGTAPGPAPARTGRGSSRRRRSGSPSAPGSGRRRRSRPSTARGSGAACPSW